MRNLRWLLIAASLWGCDDASRAADPPPADQGAAIDAMAPVDAACTPAVETCDARDEDCDGRVDEALERPCYPGAPATEGVGRCAAGRQICEGGLWSRCAEATLPEPETCDASDEDCDGRVDEGLVQGCYQGPEGTRDQGLCQAGSQVCGDGAWGLCRDEVRPAPEACDGLDQDCDGSADEGLVEPCYDGPAGTAGVGACRAGEVACTDGVWSSCQNAIGPRDETCDGTDEDCDGRVDEGAPRFWPDADGDGYGDATAQPACAPGVGRADNGDDCDDADSDVNPAAADAPDDAFADTNCDGVDGDAARLLFVDVDGRAAGSDGTRAAPFVDLDVALRAAARRPEIEGVALGAGRYVGPFEVLPGVALHGGYDARTGWTRGAQNVATLALGDGDATPWIAVRAEEIDQPTLLERLTIEVGSTTAVGGSVYGLYARDAGALVLRHVTVRAGQGGSGAPGEDGQPGGHGGHATAGGDCNGVPGQGGESACGADGGDGGAGGVVGQPGQSGAPPGCGGAGGPREGGGAGADGRPGCTPDPAADGAPGAAANPGGPFDGLWAPGDGADGEAGPNGPPGGGGGGGSGAAVIGNTAGGGGGGGAGGCGGGRGTGGTGGGGSFAVFAVDSAGLRLEMCTLESGVGGAGAPGGAGAEGGLGGDGARGGKGREAFGCGGLAGPGWGADGGAGAPGGRGGHGEGGSGGPSYPLVCVGAPVITVETALRPGQGGAPGGGPGNPGVFGAALPSLGCD